MNVHWEIPVRMPFELLHTLSRIQCLHLREDLAHVLTRERLVLMHTLTHHTSQTNEEKILESEMEGHRDNNRLPGSTSSRGRMKGLPG